jgi:hypothetical protein
MSFQIIPARKTIIAMRLIQCIALRLKLSGLLGSFFLKKYIIVKSKNKKKGVRMNSLFLQINVFSYSCLNSTRRLATRPCSVAFDAIGRVSP